MKSPRKWIFARPGFLIPVFFLSQIPVSGQHPWHESTVSAAGGCYVSRHGMTDARYNQAGLGLINQYSISIQHAQPFVIREVGIASLSLQAPLGRGGFGATISTMGIKGFRQTSSWISYGLNLHPFLSAGIGLHFRNTSIREKVFFHAGVSCALGIQFKINENLMLGAHVMHPVAWPDRYPGTDNRQMMISAGVSYTFFRTATYHSDLHVWPSGYIQWSHGLEIFLKDSFRILLGIHNRPHTLSGGIQLKHQRWAVSIAVSYRFDTGTTPSSTLSYAW